MGKGANDADKAAQKMSAEAGKELVNLNKQLQAEAAPWRKSAGEYYTKALTDPWSATAPAQSQLARDTSKAMWSNAEAEPGGARDRVARDLKMNLIAQKSNLLNQGTAQAAQNLGTLGVGQTQTGASALGGANQSASTIANIGAQQHQAKASGAGGFGAFLGGI